MSREPLILNTIFDIFLNSFAPSLTLLQFINSIQNDSFLTVHRYLFYHCEYVLLKSKIFRKEFLHHLVVAVSAYPLFSIKGNIGIVIWLFLFAITLYTASKIEKFKKRYDIQTYKEILAFIDGKQLTHDETQQEIGKRNYQKIIFAFIAGVIALIICFVVIFICSKIK